ncbi:MAG: TolC family protein [Saprospiraceae bacterium]|nr:TolC family protein [Saprospiraceae bacterium]
MIRTFHLFTLLFFIGTGISAQELLPLEEAVNLGLAQNLGIEVARVEQQSTEMQVYRSNAGFGPVLDLNANAGATVNRVQQNYLDGRVVDRFGRSLAPNVSLGLDWTVYDGGRMQATFDRLKELSNASSIETQIAIQDLVSQIIQSYYDVMRLKARVNFLNTVIKYYEDRLNITEERWNVGKGSKIDFLQSKTDLNAQLSERAIANNDFKNAKIRLNGLLNRELDIDFDVEEEVVFNADYSLPELMQTVDEKNQDVILLRKFHDISLISEREIEATRKPQVGFSSTLGFFYTNTNANFILSNQNASLNVGFNARWNILDGKHRHNQLAIARVNTHGLEKQEEDLLVRLHSQLTEAYNQYLSDKELLDFEEQNKELAEENLAISLEKFRLGDSTILELNEAQRSYDTALNRLVNAQHNIRISELRLLEISGQLVR